ncbi:MAG TPA: hypothetical protein VK165_11545 [Azonexus sp.]|nr:hypothetical protein [Azonexus sp.]
MSDDTSRKPASQPPQRFTSGMSPGDEAPEGTPGTGQVVCRHCGGSGKVEDEDCPECEGTGYVIAGIGGA